MKGIIGKKWKSTGGPASTLRTVFRVLKAVFPQSNVLQTATQGKCQNTTKAMLVLYFHALLVACFKGTTLDEARVFLQEAQQQRAGEGHDMWPKRHVEWDDYLCRLLNHLTGRKDLTPADMRSFVTRSPGNSYVVDFEAAARLGLHLRKWCVPFVVKHIRAVEASEDPNVHADAPLPSNAQMQALADMFAETKKKKTKQRGQVKHLSTSAAARTGAAAGARNAAASRAQALQQVILTRAPAASAACSTPTAVSAAPTAPAATAHAAALSAAPSPAASNPSDLTGMLSGGVVDDLDEEMLSIADMQLMEMNGDMQTAGCMHAVGDVTEEVGGLVGGLVVEGDEALALILPTAAGEWADLLGEGVMVEAEVAGLMHAEGGHADAPCGELRLGLGLGLSGMFDDGDGDEGDVPLLPLPDEDMLSCEEVMQMEEMDY